MKKILYFLITTGILTIPTITLAVDLHNPLGTSNINSLVGTIIKAVLGLSGVAALLMFVYGGTQWIISGGDPKKIQKGKDTLTWAIFGLVFIFIAYTLLYTLLAALGSTT